MANLTRRQRFARKFGAVLRQSRLDAKITLEGMATGADIDPGNLSKIERGVVVPRLDAAVRISKTLGVSLDKLAARME